ncbi:hypothetical protein CYY_007137 [Polysphondylium violaceum]|uniref:Uncharacterized protein n=1 Tax=Polysphondylium violaceum TaxID=133409 RepID=A0A8J4PPM2_9MYCE|nr:hypothetical protein CYY_007137 [Polysphondylium violaceum]
MSGNDKTGNIIKQSIPVDDTQFKPIYLQMPEPKDDFDRVKLSLITEFPSCFQIINSAVDCDRAQHSKIPGKPGSSKKCEKLRAHLNFCILSTFCPMESSALVHCMGGKIPFDSETPLRCSSDFQNFDNCLQKKATDFEANPNPPPPKAKVMYVDENTTLPK